MALQPRQGPPRADLAATIADSPFQAEADAALGAFRSLRDDLVRGVRRGDMTVKVAREQAAAAAATLRENLVPRSEGYSPAPRAFLDRLAEAAAARARSAPSLEAIQRETNRLLKLSLQEQQLQNRAAEFEGRTFVRPMSGGPSVPTLESLLAFHDQAAADEDDAAREWGRRQLEAMRPRVLDPQDRRRVDRACDRPDRVNPRLVGDYVEALQDRDCSEREAFATEALASGDASACAAAFVLARDASEGTAARWVREVLNSLNTFPDAALTTLRAWESEARRADAEAARGRAEAAAAAAEVEARLAGIEPPTAAELRRVARVHSRPLAAADEPIGLALDRRGLFPEDVDAMETAGEES